MINYFIKLLLCTGFTVLLYTHTALADEDLTSGQVTALFSGNSVTGIDLETGSPFKRFFNPDGTVINDAQGFNPTGKWHVDESGALCIKWDDEDREQCADILHNEDGTYTRIQHTDNRVIRFGNYEKFTEGNVFARGIKFTHIEAFKQEYSGSPATYKMLQAVSDFDMEQFDKAIAAGANVNATFKQRRTVLFFAVERKSRPLIGKLITAGADVNVQDSQGNTPLIVATANNFIDIVQLLLHYGADARIENNDSEDALAIAKAQKLRAAAQIITENKYGASALGLFIDIKSMHIAEDQFRLAAVDAFESRTWHVDKAENNTVSGSYERANRVYKCGMIYQPNLLLIKFDTAMGGKNANYLLALQNQFFRSISIHNPQNADNVSEALGIFIDIKNKHITEDQFRQAAVTAFEARRWHVDKAEDDTVYASYENSGDVYKSRMIYQPDQLTIKFDSTGSYREVNHLYALRKQFFRTIEYKNP